MFRDIPNADVKLMGSQQRTLVVLLATSKDDNVTDGPFLSVLYPFFTNR